MHLTTDSAARKNVPICTGVFDYFPLALAEVARLSKIGNDKHNAGQPLHWSRDKSTDHADCIIRHMLDRGTIDADGILHDAKVAWRALAQLQLALEALQQGTDLTPEQQQWVDGTPEERRQNGEITPEELAEVTGVPEPMRWDESLGTFVPYSAFPERTATSGIGVVWGHTNIPVTETL